MSEIRASVEQAVERLTADPRSAVVTDPAAVATAETSLRVEVVGPSGMAVTTDMPTELGGHGEKPTPGWLLRAAVASCAASTIEIEAARAGVYLGALRVIVDSDSDDRGFLGMDSSVPAGPLIMRMSVLVDPGADVAAVAEVVQRAVLRSPVCDAVRRAVDLSVDVAEEDAAGPPA